ncbi:MAG: uracil-DNA glycosylase [Sulfuricurvum sp.]
MDSYQNLALLQNLYRLRILGYHYIDPITPNAVSGSHKASEGLPSSLSMLEQSIRDCYLCDLSKSRRQSMSGYGNPHAKIVFVDAYVSAAEDESNGYYVGRSGNMLKDMIEKVLNLSVHDVYLTHAVKCKPFGFQTPSPSECSSCAPFLSRQLDVISPSVIVPLGPDALRLVLGEANDFERLRGEVVPFGRSVVIATYNPVFLLRNPSLKKDAMRDLLTIKAQLS